MSSDGDLFGSGQPDSADPLELRKPHEMIVMIPRSKRVTLTGRRIYNALLQVSQEAMASMDSMPPADHMFRAPLPSLLRATGSSGEDRTAAKRYLREMRSLEVDWESTAPGDGVKWRGFAMLSEVAIEIRGGENWVSWSYPPTIMAALREPHRWAQIDLNILAKLGTYAAVALYEICARYRGSPSGLTSRKPATWWIAALSHVPEGAERREWRKFKNERVQDAIAEINSETDIEIELIEHKAGRAVAELQFAVRRKRLPLVVKHSGGSLVDAGLILLAESLGIRELKLEGLLREFGDAKVRVNLEILKRRLDNKQLRGIENTYSYLRSMLRNDVAAKDAQVQEGAAPIDSPSSAPARTVATAVPNPASTFVIERIAAIKATIGAANADVRQALVDQALQDLAQRRMLTAVVSRRAAQGDVLHGLLGATVVKLYALATYGPGWDKPPADIADIEQEPLPR
jgi:hypothetical protein